MGAPRGRGESAKDGLAWWFPPKRSLNGAPDGSGGLRRKVPGGRVVQGGFVLLSGDSGADLVVLGVGHQVALQDLAGVGVGAVGDDALGGFVVDAGEGL